MSVAVAAVCWSGLSAVRVCVVVIPEAWSRGHQVVTELCRPLEDVDGPSGAVDAHAVAVVDALRRVLSAHHGGNTKLAREHGRMPRQTARVRHETSDLREHHDPGRGGHGPEGGGP